MEIKNIFKLITLKLGQKMKVKDLMLKTGLHYALNVIVKFTVDVWDTEKKYCKVIVDRMLKLDPTLTVKRNGLPYKTNSEITANAES